MISKCFYLVNHKFRALKGHPSVLLPIIDFCLLRYSKPVATYINDKGFELFG